MAHKMGTTVTALCWLLILSRALPGLQSSVSAAEARSGNSEVPPSSRDHDLSFLMDYWLGKLRTSTDVGNEQAGDKSHVGRLYGLGQQVASRGQASQDAEDLKNLGDSESVASVSKDDLSALEDLVQRGGESMPQPATLSPQSKSSSATTPDKQTFFILADFSERLHRLNDLLPSCNRPTPGLPCVSFTFIHLANLCTAFAAFATGPNPRVRRHATTLPEILNAHWIPKYKFAPAPVEGDSADLIVTNPALNNGIANICSKLDSTVQEVLSQVLSQAVAEPAALDDAYYGK